MTYIQRSTSRFLKRPFSKPYLMRSCTVSTRRTGSRNLSRRRHTGTYGKKSRGIMRRKRHIGQCTNSDNRRRIQPQREYTISSDANTSRRSIYLQIAKRSEFEERTVRHAKTMPQPTCISCEGFEEGDRRSEEWDPTPTTAASMIGATLRPVRYYFASLGLT